MLLCSVVLAHMLVSTHFSAHCSSLCEPRPPELEFHMAFFYFQNLAKRLLRAEIYVRVESGRQLNIEHKVIQVFSNAEKQQKLFAELQNIDGQVHPIYTGGGMLPLLLSICCTCLALFIALFCTCYHSHFHSMHLSPSPAT